MTELRWRPLLVMNDAVTAVNLQQIDASTGIVTSRNRRMPNKLSPAELAEWQAFSSKYLSSSDAGSEAAKDGYLLARSIVSVLQSMRGELSPERLADSFRLLPTGGSPRRRAIDLIRFDGKTWEVIETDLTTPASRNAPLRP
jgi:hypothetical protein